MIPRAYITEWSSTVPWPTDEQIEQDLLLSRVLCEIYRDDFLSERLAFRGGTALHKLYLFPQPRYSEDIDLVQIHPEPIKPTIQTLQKRLTFLGDASVQQKRDNNTLIYKVTAESDRSIVLRLKIEINCREHFSEMVYKTIPFEIKNGWYSDSCDIKTYEVEELLGTKLRALYQRKKGRDLFDLHHAINILPDLDVQNILNCYRSYMEISPGTPPTSKQFLQNMMNKMNQSEFHGDTVGLLRPDIRYDYQ